MAIFSWGYTGSMMEQLAQWYDWVPFDGNLWDCGAGDILLRVTEGSPSAHTAIVTEPGRILEASWDFDGRDGDSSGTEVSEHGIYNDAWEWVGTPKKGVLSEAAIDAGIEWGRAFAADNSHGYSQDGNKRWANEADCSSLVLRIVSVMTEHVGSGGSEPQPAAPASDLPQPRYRCMLGGEWLEWRSDGEVCGNEGEPMEDFEADGLGEGGWFQLTLMDGTELGHNETNAAHEQLVRGITVYYFTPDGHALHEAVYRVGVLGGEWLKTEYDDDDGGAGDDVHAVDRFQMRLGRCGDRQPF